MKIRINSGKLSQAIELIYAALDMTKDISAVLKNIYLKAEDKKLHLCMSDDWSFAQFALDCDVIEPGVILIEAAFLKDFSKINKNSMLELSQTGTQRTNIIGHGGDFNVPLTDPQLFPMIPEKPEGGLLLGIDLLARLIEKTSYAATDSKELGRLTDVVHLEQKDNMIFGVSTDTYRIVIMKEKFEAADQLSGSIDIPKKVCKSLTDLAKKLPKKENKEKNTTDEFAEEVIDEFKTVRILYTDNKINFIFNDLFISCRKLVGEFPQLLPMLDVFKSDATVTVLPTTLRDKISAVVALKGEAVRFELEQTGLKISENSEKGDGKVHIPCDVDGDITLKTALNAKQLLEYLNSLLKTNEVSVNEVTMNLSATPGMPVLLVYETDNGSINYFQSPNSVAGFND